MITVIMFILAVMLGVAIGTIMTLSHKLAVERKMGDKARFLLQGRAEEEW